MGSFLSRTIWPWTAAIAALALLAGAALAHDDRHVGEYKLNVGFNVEPAYEGVPNGIDIRVTRSAEGDREDDHGGDEEGGNGDGHDSDEESGNGDGHDSDEEGGNGDGHDSDGEGGNGDGHDSDGEGGNGDGGGADGMSMTDEDATTAPAGIPVEGLAETLQVEVTHVPSGASRIMDLRAVFQAPGDYTADLIPTAPGVYQVRVFGSIEETAVDETFVSAGGGGGFSDVESKTDLYFPEPLAEIRELESAVRGAVAAAQEAQDAALAGSSDTDSEDGDSGNTLAIVAIILGAAGAVAGSAAGIVAVRRRGS